MTSASQKARHCAPAPLTAYRGTLRLVTGSGTISTGSTGEIASESCRITLPPSLSVTVSESRSPRGGLKIATTICRSSGSERQYGFGGRPYRNNLIQFRYPFRLMWGRYNLCMTSCTLSAPFYIITAIGKPSAATCGRLIDGGGDIQGTGKDRSNGTFLWDAV